MTADGFLAQKHGHPLAMTAAIAINAAAVTALMLAKTGVVHLPPDIFIAYPVPMPSPPPEHVEQPKPKQQAPETRPVFQPKPIEKAEAPTRPDIADTTEFPVKIDDPIRPIIVDPGLVLPKEPSKPVVVEATPDSRFAGEFQPPYPSQLLRTGIEGKAVVKVLIGTDGRVKQVVIVSADDPLFADASERQALRRWRFRPATRDGVPIESWKQMTVRFEIRA
ncbi:putative TonB-like protein [Sphingomonas changbaiensis NBRC 104936]|uniref:Protein TonB n=1 Tax=Sphingomonas changbaiensis NBRC 104936 TaxID=1219043 RepID=A0A0E9MQI3_9SPHN|nr:energy transducer TonB [Sphingomonas changbaiensis]GAO40022.1 putative TonB-like protein [Sphingomonas changbaiensis NBRC 104936]